MGTWGAELGPVLLGALAAWLSYRRPGGWLPGALGAGLAILLAASRPGGLLPVAAWLATGVVAGRLARPHPPGLRPEDGLVAVATLVTVSLWVSWRLVKGVSPAHLGSSQLLGLYLLTPVVEVAVAGLGWWRAKVPLDQVLQPYRRRSGWAWGLGVGLALSLLAALVVAAESQGLHWSVRSNNPLVYAPQFFAHPDWPLGVLVVAVVGMAPAAEEFLFRGLFLEALRRRWGATWAVVLSGATFAAAHFDPTLFWALWLAGIGLGWLYVRTRSLVPSTIAHATFNALSVAMALAAFHGR
ncbi:MAG: CPBP family intramembrane metalloprotease [Firmicutes bacterium]|nr:CPBP family intramembrane metalloprotease [Bacillota bacterium]